MVWRIKFVGNAPHNQPPTPLLQVIAESTIGGISELSQDADEKILDYGQNHIPNPTNSNPTSSYPNPNPEP